MEISGGVHAEPEVAHTRAHHHWDPKQMYLELFCFGMAGYLMLCVALFNGYPVFFFDSVDYMWDSLTLHPLPYHPITYAAFIRLVSFGTNPWLVVVAQSALTIFVLHAVFRYIVREYPPSKHAPLCFLGLTGFLAFGTTLPWFVGQVMSDIFTGLLFLCLFLLLYDSNLSRMQAVQISVVLGLTVAAHASHFLCVAVLLLAILILRAFKSARAFWPRRSIKGIAAFVLVPILLAIGFVSWANWRAGYGFTVSPAAPCYILGRLMESGLAESYLEQRCQIEHLTPCKYLHHLPIKADDFLWGGHPLLNEMGGWIGARQEANKIVWGTILHSPGRFAAECLRQTLRQLVTFRAGYPTYSDQNNAIMRLLGFIDPGAANKYRYSRQWSGSLAGDARKLSRAYTAIFCCSLLVCIVQLVRSRSSTTPADPLFVLTAIFVVVNAGIMSSLAILDDRYEARVIWLVPLCCAAYILPGAIRQTSATRDSQGL